MGVGLFDPEDRTGDQHDAFSIAEWLRRADKTNELSQALNPPLSDDERRTAAIEGWILGVTPRREGPVRLKTKARSTAPRTKPSAPDRLLAREVAAIVTYGLFGNGHAADVRAEAEAAVISAAAKRVYSLLRLKSDNPAQYESMLRLADKYARDWQED